MASNGERIFRTLRVFPMKTLLVCVCDGGQAPVEQRGETTGEVLVAGELFRQPMTNYADALKVFICTQTPLAPREFFLSLFEVSVYVCFSAGG